MTHRALLFISSVLCVLLSASPVLANEVAHSHDSSRHKGFSVGGGIGFTASPTSFLMQFEAPYDFGNGLALGPQLQIGVDGVTTIVGATLDLRYGFDLSSTSNDIASGFEPFVNGGLGLAYMKHEIGARFRPEVEVDEVDFMMNLGFGIAYHLSRRVVLESRMEFNIVPGRVIGDNFYYTWQMLGARYKF